LSLCNYITYTVILTGMLHDNSNTLYRYATRKQ